LDEEWLVVLKEAWGDNYPIGDAMESVQSKLSASQFSLSRWSSRKFRQSTKVLHQMTQQLKWEQNRENPNNIDTIKRLQGEIDVILARDDAKWKQRSKQNWYRGGDRNTQYFHAWANHRRKINSIQHISDERGQLWKTKPDISRAFIHYFEKLFTTQGPSRIQECLMYVEPSVTAAMNCTLEQPFVEAEVVFALSEMHPLKAPGLDGFPTAFYQKSWATTGSEVCRAVLHFLNGGLLDTKLNATNLVLIPKISNPSRVSEYRPISLCNVIYKLISKVLANRLKRVLPSVISLEQSAFIPGRLITDNVLVAFETLHTMDTRLKGKEGFMVLKLDMSKAYDRLEWDFLEAIMRKMGFAERWIGLMMSCVRSVSYSILIDGHPHGHIIPTRGVRQGDPLSPYFFILCAEAMSSLLHFKEMSGRLPGIPIGRSGISINHLFFADDSLLFCRANLHE